MLKIPCTIFRGGTSKGPFFLKSNLPSDPTLRNELLLNLMGSPHERQIDGIGGGDSLSSKVAIVGSSSRKDADVNYLLCQVYINDSIVDTSLNCGNMLSAVAPFAIESGLVKTSSPINVDKTNGDLNFPRASFVRTARPLFEGKVVVSNYKI